MSEATNNQDSQGWNCPHCDEWVHQPEESTIEPADCPSCGAAPPLSSAPKVTTPPPGKSCAAINALLCFTSVVVILGIYGFSIYQTKSRVEEVALAPVLPTAEKHVETPINNDEPETKPFEEEPAIVEQDSDAPMPEELDPTPPALVADLDATPPEAIEEMENPEETTPDAIVVVDEPETSDETTDTPATGDDLALVIDEELEPAVVVETAAFDEQAFLAEGWKTEASETLRGFMAATTLEERLAHVIDPERVRAPMRAIQEQDTTPWQNLQADDFKHSDLSEEDRRKGIFLMLRETHGDDDATRATGRNYAFFKRTDDGLKLDFEVFSQTTGQDFEQFIANQQPGVSKVFRVFIAEDPQAPASDTTNYRAYFIVGLSDFGTAARIRMTKESPAGRILNTADFTSEDGTRRIMRNATVELRWTDQPEHSALELSKFICWEFLGLGGQPFED